MINVEPIEKGIIQDMLDKAYEQGCKDMKREVREYLLGE